MYTSKCRRIKNMLAHNFNGWSNNIIVKELSPYYVLMIMSSLWTHNMHTHTHFLQRNHPKTHALDFKQEKKFVVSFSTFSLHPLVLANRSWQWLQCIEFYTFHQRHNRFDFGSWFDTDFASMAPIYQANMTDRRVGHEKQNLFLHFA